MSAINYQMQEAQGEAEAITYAQIAAALRMNKEFFDDQGMTHFPAILHAIVINYAAHLPRQPMPE